MAFVHGLIGSSTRARFNAEGEGRVIALERDLDT